MVTRRDLSRSKLSGRSFAARDRALHALADMRHGSSSSQAARDNGVSIRTLKKYAGSALLQDRSGGRIRATKGDRLLRYVQIPGPFGPIEIVAHGSKEASDAARYDAAVNRYLRGDLEALAPWHGKKIGGIASVITSKAANDYHFKTGQRDWPSRTENVLSCRLLWWQVGFGAPASRAALEHVTVVQ